MPFRVVFAMGRNPQPPSARTPTAVLAREAQSLEIASSSRQSRRLPPTLNPPSPVPPAEHAADPDLEVHLTAAVGIREDGLPGKGRKGVVALDQNVDVQD